MTPRRRIDPFSFCCNIFYRENFPPPQQIYSNLLTILAITTKHELVTDKTLLVPSFSQKRKTVPKNVFPPSKHPLLVSFAPFRELKAAAHLLTRTSDQAKKSRNLPFGGHVCLRDFCRAPRTRTWVPESKLTNQTKVSFVPCLALKQTFTYVYFT